MAAAEQERIRTQCGCGKRLAVPHEWAGRRVRCPACKNPLTIPLPLDDLSGDLLSELARGETIAPPPATGAAPPEAPLPIAPGDGRECPSCGRVWPKTAKLCVGCGIDLNSGRAILQRDDSTVDNAYIYTEGLLRTASWLMPLGVLPIASEAFGLRKPWATRAIAGVTIVVSLWYMVAFLYAENPDPSLARLMHWSGGFVDAEIAKALGPYTETRWYQPLTAALLHGDPLHLAGNLLFLFVLGSRVNMLIGNALTLALYVLLAFVSGWVDGAMGTDGPRHPSLGASGAIMGLAGMYLALFPTTHVHVAAWARLVFTGFRLVLRIFPVRGFWVVAFYIAQDALFTILGAESGVAHWAHLGGFFAGVALAMALLIARAIDARGGDLLSVVLGRHAWKLIGKPGTRRLALW